MLDFYEGAVCLVHDLLGLPPLSLRWKGKQVSNMYLDVHILRAMYYQGRTAIPGLWQGCDDDIMQAHTAQCVVIPVAAGSEQRVNIVKHCFEWP